jgi:hypothetical protein
MLTIEQRADFVVENIEDASLREDVRTRVLAALLGQKDAIRSAVHMLLEYLRSFNVTELMDDHFLRKHGNSAPGELLRSHVTNIRQMLSE